MENVEKEGIMNRKIGLVSSMFMAGSIIIFFISLGLALVERKTYLDMISFGVCILLSWTYLISIIAYSHFCHRDKAVAAEVGKVFGVIYSIYVTLVYFTQLTVVKNGVLSREINHLFDYTLPDSWMFGINLIGYGIMALSTFFIGLSMLAIDFKGMLLKRLLLLHGVFAVCVILPMTSLFLENSNHDITGTIVLMVWCVIFLPIALLFVDWFVKIKE